MGSPQEGQFRVDTVVVDPVSLYVDRFGLGSGGLRDATGDNPNPARKTPPSEVAREPRAPLSRE